MQINLDKSDRRLLLWTTIFLVPLVILLAFFSDTEKGPAFPTTYSANSKGAKAAYLFLKEQGYNVERWELPPDDLPDDARNTVLVVADPSEPLSKDQANYVQMFLDRGGPFLVSGYLASFFVPQKNAVPAALPDSVWKDFQPEMLSPLTRGGAIKMSPSSHWGQAMPGQLVHYAHDGDGVVVSYKVGQGEVIWWADSTPLTNAGIREAGNLSLFLNSLGGSRNVRILWDEYFHFRRDATIASYIAKPLMWGGLAQFALILLATIITMSRRHAPIRELPEASRLSPLEFVHTLGGLYQRSGATRIALEVPYNRFRMALIRRLGLRSDISGAEMVRAAVARLDYKDPDFELTLKEIVNGLNEPDLPEAKVLELVQRLTGHIRNLKLFSQEEEEKKPNADRL